MEPQQGSPDFSGRSVGVRPSSPDYARLIAVLAILAVLRAVYAAVVPLDLVADEAYYWDWSRQLDWGYYSKPPLIAWLIALATSVGGDHAAVVRLPAVLLGTFGLALVCLLTERMYGRRAAIWATALTAATPGNVALSLLMTIDAPLTFCWSAALYAWWRLLEPGAKRRRWLAAAVVATGCGLLAKQTMLAFFVLLPAFLLVSPRHRGEFRRPAIWIWTFGSLLFLAPTAWWNSRHGWLTVQHTSEHFTLGRVDWVEHLRFGGEFLAVQAGLFSPLTFGLLAVAAVAATLAWPRLDDRARYLFCFSGLPWWGVVALSFTKRVQPNWPAPFYAALFTLAVGLLVERRPLGEPVDRLRRYARPALACGVVLCLGLYLLPFAIYPLGLAGTSFDPTGRLRGWKEFGLEAGRALSDVPHPDETLVVVTHGRNPIGEIAFYAPGHPRVYGWNPTGTISSQYDLWGYPRDAFQREALIFTPTVVGVPPELAAAYADVKLHREIFIDLGASRRLDYRVWRAVPRRTEASPVAAGTAADAAVYTGSNAPNPSR